MNQEKIGKFIASERKKKKYFINIKISNLDELLEILTDCKCNIWIVHEIPTKMFNQELENLNVFLKNIARNSGSSRVFIGTKDNISNMEQ